MCGYNILTMAGKFHITAIPENTFVLRGLPMGVGLLLKYNLLAAHDVDTLMHLIETLAGKVIYRLTIDH